MNHYVIPVKKYFEILCNPMTVGEAIRELRGKQTMQAFGTMLGLSMSSISYYEKGRSPEPKALLRFRDEASRRGRVELVKTFETKLNEELGAAGAENGARLLVELRAARVQLDVLRKGLDHKRLALLEPVIRHISAAIQLVDHAAPIPLAGAHNQKRPRRQIKRD